VDWNLISFNSTGWSVNKSTPFRQKDSEYQDIDAKQMPTYHNNTIFFVASAPPETNLQKYTSPGAFGKNPVGDVQ
jgi:hypothetical protein